MKLVIPTSISCLSLLTKICLLLLILTTAIIGSPYDAKSQGIEAKVIVSSNMPPEEPDHAPTAGSMGLSDSGSFSSNSGGAVTRNTVYNGNLTIGSNSSLRIINTTYSVHGYVFVYGNLTLENSTLETLPPNGDYANPFGVWFLDHANATFYNSTTFSHIATYNSSSVLIERSNITNISPRVGGLTYPPNLDTFGGSHAFIDNSIFRWTDTWGNSKLIVNNSRVTVIGPGDHSEVFIYNSTVREFSAFDNSVTNIYSTGIGYFVDIELNCTVFLWNSSFPRIGPNGVPSFSIVAIGIAATKRLVGIRLQSKLPLGPGVKDGGATIDITSDSAVSGELRFYWGVFASADDTFQRLGLQKDGVRIVSWNGSSWQILRDQGSVDFGYTVGGYFWAKFDRAGVYALVSYPVPNFTAWLLFGASFVGLIGLALWFRRKRRARQASSDRKAMNESETSAS